MPESNERGFIAVHVGAGFHAHEKSKVYKAVCKEAALKGIEKLQSGLSALEAATAAVRTLEDSPFTNAGRGANLTITGTVECDAGVMDGKTLTFGAVGAMPDIQNPVLVAHKLVTEQQKGNLSLGRIPPSVLVGTGAKDWAVRHGIPVASETSLVTEESKKTHKRHMDCIQSHARKRLRFRDEKEQSEVENSDVNSSPHDVREESELLDTVGAVCLDCHGNVAAASSSGGILLKQPGRVGQAATYACGSWAQNCNCAVPGIAVTTTGCGEHLVKTVLAKELADALTRLPPSTDLTSEIVRETVCRKFLNSPFLQNVEEKQAGFLIIKCDAGTEDALEGEFIWAHTTDSMCFASMSVCDSVPQVSMSRLPDHLSGGRSVLIGGNKIR